MLNDDRKALCIFRLEKAQECIESAKRLIEMNDYSAAANRSYYSIFHAIRAIMALDGEDRKKHSGIISYFLEYYVKPGIFSTQYSYVVKNAFNVRQESDYEDFFVISKSEVAEQVESAKYFIEEVKKYTDSRVV